MSPPHEAAQVAPEDCAGLAAHRWANQIQRRMRRVTPPPRPARPLIGWGPVGRCGRRSAPSSACWGASPHLVPSRAVVSSTLLDLREAAQAGQQPGPGLSTGFGLQPGDRGAGPARPSSRRTWCYLNTAFSTPSRARPDRPLAKPAIRNLGDQLHVADRAGERCSAPTTRAGPAPLFETGHVQLVQRNLPPALRALAASTRSGTGVLSAAASCLARSQARERPSFDFEYPTTSGCHRARVSPVPQRYCSLARRVAPDRDVAGHMADC